ncbi:hypothetical protein [Streptomyces sp. NRRL S-350]|uniref:hypothetical protein n=1 Tax=Streptomyces sp. NRRL S-350 TaxID=1463902 RepID=UPI00068CF2BA|nr:hypothetical protein [Streptomyces sp. NRRL S-350]
MSESVASTLVEVMPAPQNQPPPEPKTPPPPAAPPSGAMPGVPLAVAVANALGTVGAGVASLGGPAAVAVVGAAAGAAALGGLARKARTRHTTSPRLPAHRAGGAHRTAGGGGLFTPPARAATRSAGPNYGSQQGRSATTPGAASRSGPSPAGHRAASAVSPHHTAAPKGAGMPRTAGTMPPAAHHGTRSHTAGSGSIPGQAGRPTPAGRGASRYRPSAAVHTLAKAASRLPGLQDRGPGGRVEQRAAARDQRLARVAERTARRVAKGQAKALQAAGIDPATGAGARPKSPAAGRGQITPVQAKALKRSAMRHQARMGGAALATGLVGLGSTLVGNWRHKGRVAGHMRNVWRRMAERARAVRDARNAAILGRDDPAADPAPGVAGVPVPAETVNIPGRPAPTPAATDGPVEWSLFGRPCRPDTTPTVEPITLGKPTVKENPVTTPIDGTAATFSLTSAADVLLQAATTFDPETMVEFGAFADELPTAYGTLQEVLRVLAEKASEQLPLDPVVVEEISQGYQAMGRVVQALEEVAPTFRQAHAEDLERHENPRNGLEAERKWNV